MSAFHRSSEWSKVVRVNRPRIAATLPARCVNRCKRGGTVYPEDRWDVAHIIDHVRGGTNDPENLGPAHAGCNRSDGGKLGAAIAIANKKARARVLGW